MSLETFNKRLDKNIAGKYYVDNECTDCDLCRDTAPTIFRRDDETGGSYVFKQPQTPEEIKHADEAIEGCPCENIHADGDLYDWSKPCDPLPSWRTGETPKPECKHCTNASLKPWWKFWH